jgi:hypothetical protein
MTLESRLPAGSSILLGQALTHALEPQRIFTLTPHPTSPLRGEVPAFRDTGRQPLECDSPQQPEKGFSALKPASIAGRRYPPSRPAMMPG